MYVTLVFSGIMTILYIYLCTKLKFEIHWFAPAFCFLYGLIWAYFQKLIDKNLEKSISLLIALIFAFYFGVVVWGNLEYGWLQFKSIMYLTVIITIGTRVKLKSKVMEWLGSISYEIYLVHGLFFMLLCNESINIANGFTFTVTVLALSCSSAYFIHNYIVCRLKNKINIR